MKIRVSLKDPDSMHDAVVDAFKKAEKPAGISASEWAVIKDERVGEAQHLISGQWMPYGEYLLVEFDTEAGTATVLPASAWR